MTACALTADLLFKALYSWDCLWAEGYRIAWQDFLVTRAITSLRSVSGHQPTMNSLGSCSKVGISLLTPDTLALRGNGRFISSRAPVNLTSEEILLHIITMCLDVLIGGREKLWGKMHEKLEITSSTLNPRWPFAHKTHYSQTYSSTAACLLC